jgi:hypothetical protein
VSRCLEKEVRERIPSALDVNHELRRVRKTVERGASARPPSRDLASIAVLPFANRSASADDEYFSDGLADELLNVLAKIKGLRVTARTPHSLQRKQVTAAEIGRALNVATLSRERPQGRQPDPRLRAARERVRQLTPLVRDFDRTSRTSSRCRTTSRSRWLRSYERRSSVRRLTRTRAELRGRRWRGRPRGAGRIRGAPPVPARATPHRSENPRGRGESHWIPGGGPGTGSANALAWVELGRAHGSAADAAGPLAEGMGGPGKRPSERWHWSRICQKGTHGCFGSSDPRLGLSAAEISVARALELSPGSVEVLRAASALALFLSRLTEATELTREALEQDP